MARITIYVGNSPAATDAAARRHLDALGLPVLESLPTPGWPFERHVTPVDLPHEPVAIRARRLHRAFPAGQTAGTRLVLTQSSYQLQRWLDWLEQRPGSALVCDAHAVTVSRQVPEAVARRGPWSHLEVVEIEGACPESTEAAADASDLPVAFEQPEAEHRLAICARAAAADAANPAIQLAWASACMEARRLDEAQRALERALTLAPDWEAAHFEYGKLWLRVDSTERAAAAFAEAGRLMPAFSAAFSNLGAALGELGRSEEALAALRQALRHDPYGHPVLNNIGVVSRELGLLADAEQAFRQVVSLAPGFVFGHYNLGHTLCLQGRFAAALVAYDAGMARDPQRNPRQACRLAMVRAAAGDTARAGRELLEGIERVPQDMRRDVLEEMESTLSALSTLPGVDAEGMKTLLSLVRRYST